MTLFDAYLIIDWSSAAKDTGPRERKDTVWIGEVVGDGEPTASYRRTRALAIGDVQHRLQEHVNLGRRVLVGFDFPYGYPRGFATALGLDSGVAPWRAVWKDLLRPVSDGADNRNNRFAVASALNERCGPGPGPFWGTPEQSRTAHLTTGRKGDFSYPYKTGSGIALPQWRIPEPQRLSPWRPR